jgi:hypothetical protein
MAASSNFHAIEIPAMLYLSIVFENYSQITGGDKIHDKRAFFQSSANPQIMFPGDT